MSNEKANKKSAVRLIWDEINEDMIKYSEIRVNPNVSESEKTNKRNEIWLKLFSDKLRNFYKNKYAGRLLKFEDKLQAAYDIEELFIDTICKTIDEYEASHLTNKVRSTLAGFAEETAEGLYIKKCKIDNGRSFYFIPDKYQKDNKTFFSKIKERMENNKIYSEPVYYKNQDKYITELLTNSNDELFKKGHIMAVKSDNSEFTFYVITECETDKLKIDSDLAMTLNKRHSGKQFPIFYAINDDKVISVGFSTVLKLKEAITVSTKYSTHFEFKFKKLLVDLLKNKNEEPTSTDIGVEDGEGNKTEIIDTIANDNDKSEDIYKDVLTDINEGSKGGYILMLIMNALEVYKRQGNRERERLQKLDVFKKLYAEYVAIYFTAFGESHDEYNPIDNFIDKYEANIFENSLDKIFLDYIMNGNCRTYDEFMKGKEEGKIIEYRSFKSLMKGKIAKREIIYSGFLEKNDKDVYIRKNKLYNGRDIFRLETKKYKNHEKYFAEIRKKLTAKDNVYTEKIKYRIKDDMVLDFTSEKTKNNKSYRDGYLRAIKQNNEVSFYIITEKADEKYNINEKYCRNLECCTQNCEETPIFYTIVHNEVIPLGFSTLNYMSTINADSLDNRIYSNYYINTTLQVFTQKNSILTNSVV